MGKIGRFHPFIPYIVLLRTQKTPYIVIYPFVTALKSFGSDPISVQIRLLAPEKWEGLSEISLIFVIKNHLGQFGDKKQAFSRRLCINVNARFFHAKKLGT